MEVESLFLALCPGRVLGSGLGHYIWGLGFMLIAELEGIRVEGLGFRV